MSSTATLTITPLPALGLCGKRIEVDCPHGTTTLHLAAGADAPPVPEQVLAAVAVVRRRSEERCACTRQLRRRLGLKRQGRP